MDPAFDTDVADVNSPVTITDKKGMQGHIALYTGLI